MRLNVNLPRHRSRLLPLWRTAGWLTGALPAWVGPRAVYATIEAVATFVDQHYAEQIESINRHDPGCKPPSLALRMCPWLVAVGSRVAVKICRSA